MYALQHIFCKLTHLKAHTQNRHFKGIHNVFKTYIDYNEEVFPTQANIYYN